MFCSNIEVLILPGVVLGSSVFGGSTFFYSSSSFFGWNVVVGNLPGIGLAVWAALAWMFCSKTFVFNFPGAVVEATGLG